MITDTHRVLEAKGKDAYMATNRIGLMMAANPGWSVPAGLEERRFFVLGVSGHRAASQEMPANHPNRLYWTGLYRELEDGGRAAFLHHLINFDLGDWHPRAEIPKTAAQGEQALESLPNYDRFYFERLRGGQLATHDLFRPEADIAESWEWVDTQAVRPAELVDACAEWMRNNRRIMAVTGKGLLNALRPYGVKGGGDVKVAGERAWIFPPLQEARDIFSKRVGFDVFGDD